MNGEALMQNDFLAFLLNLRQQQFFTMKRFEVEPKPKQKQKQLIDLECWQLSPGQRLFHLFPLVGHAPVSVRHTRRGKDQTRRLCTASSSEVCENATKSHKQAESHVSSAAHGLIRSAQR